MGSEVIKPSLDDLKRPPVLIVSKRCDDIRDSIGPWGVNWHPTFFSGKSVRNGYDIAWPSILRKPSPNVLRMKPRVCDSAPGFQHVSLKCQAVVVITRQCSIKRRLYVASSKPKEIEPKNGRGVVLTRWFAAEIVGFAKRRVVQSEDSHPKPEPFAVS
jgi:hypothetical protein